MTRIVHWIMLTHEGSLRFQRGHWRRPSRDPMAGRAFIAPPMPLGIKTRSPLRGGRRGVTFSLCEQPDIFTV